MDFEVFCLSKFFTISILSINALLPRKKKQRKCIKKTKVAQTHVLISYASGMHGIKTLKQRARRHSSINYRKKSGQFRMHHNVIQGKAQRVGVESIEGQVRCQQTNEFLPNL
jgi:hypothetical protein